MLSEPVGPVLGHIRRLAVALQPTQTDGKLLDDFLTRHDEQAFAALMKRHGPLVMAVCRRVLPNVQDAEDAFQATFLFLARRASRLAGAESLGGWLHEVGYRMAMNIRRSNARRRRREGQVKVSTVEPVDQSVAWKDLQQTIDQAIAGLPPIYREPFILCCL